MNNTSNGNVNPDIRAVILDLDGTLLNTEQVTRDILKNFLVKYGKVPDAEKDRKRLGMSNKEAAIGVVTDYELPLTPEQFIEEIMPMYHGLWQKAKPLPGVNRLMRHLRKHGVPFALASNSVTKNINSKISLHEGWKENFAAILGSDQVKSGKPSPDIFLEAANRMNVDPVHCFVIEDSVVGVKAGKAAGMKVLAVPSLQVESHIYSMADTIIHSLLEFQPELWGLPQFEDWIDNTLPIEPIRISGLYCDGLLLECEDDRWTADFPDQVWGLYIGWVRVDGHEVYNKAVQVCIVGRTEEGTFDSKMQLLLVGFIRRSCYAGNMLKNLEILEEDKVAANISLDLSILSYDTLDSF
ncbi:bifunctional riboflavin kinase/fmn phosphatase [Phtheirospermum japonicum]|uniref:Bifunctional riboflavin kinase/fmn phosphatase n=1 Tax=Phtheirospermum japonicum TaxID=374723 RepID=A0A830B3X9_9LAMI|nr:bifunctional riboflavin kinase/fmn phosphatase [Phtheirospermum japonicum]